jgi:hypothetical protein
MKNILLTLIVFGSFGAFAQGLDTTEEKSKDGLQYEIDIKFKYFADLSGTYHRCASLFTAMYGHASNTPSETLFGNKALDYMQQATSVTWLAIYLNKEIGYEGMPDIDAAMNHTMFIKRVIRGMVEGEKEATSFINNQLRTCRSAVEAYPLDEKK